MNRFFCSAFLIGSLALAGEPDAVREAGEIYLRSFSHEMTEEEVQTVDPEKERYISWIYELFFSKKYSDEDKIATETYRTREVLVQILASQIGHISQSVKTSPHIFEDSRILGEETPGRSSMLDILFPGYTLSGEVFKALSLAQPTSSVEELQRQQALIRKTMRAGSLRESLSDTLKQLKIYEPTAVSLLDKSDVIYSPDIQKLANAYGGQSQSGKMYNTLKRGVWKSIDILFYFLQITSLMALGADPFITKNYFSCAFCSRLAYLIFALGSRSLLTGVEYYIDKLMNQNNQALYKAIRVRIDILSYYLRQAMKLQQASHLPDELKLEFSADEMSLIESFLRGTEWLITADQEAQKNHLEYASEMLWYSLELKQTFAKILYQTGKIDMYLSIGSRMKSADGHSGQLTFVRFEPGKPVIKAQGLWNPTLGSSHVVTNDISLETRDSCLPPDENSFFRTETCSAKLEPSNRNLLLSGCNASGKSTMMRAITINSIFLAQIFGIASAESFQTSLFHSIHSHMDKYDPTGEFSSYEGELNRALQALKEAETLESNQNMLVCFDELFSNTDPEESLYVTNKVLSAMAKQLRTINIVSSHYDVDTRGIEGDDEFARMHMHVEKINNTLIKTYQLRRGQNTKTNGLFHLMDKFKLFPDIYSELELLIENQD